MKRNLILILIVNFLFLVSCEQVIETENPIVNDLETQNEAVDLLALAMAKAMNYVEFRQLIRYETNKQFDYDYDVLYRFIKDKDLIIDGENISISDLLLNGINDEIEKSTIDRKYLEWIDENIPSLNVCVPFQYKDWNPTTTIPNVALIPIGKFNGEVFKSYKANGNSFQILKSKGYPETPVITIGLSERIDEDGLLKVSPDGFIIDKKYRKITAQYAYDNYEEFSSKKYPSKICLVDELKIIDKQKTKSKIVSSIKPPFNANAVATVETPTISKVVPSYSRYASAYIEWTPVDSAVSYDVQMKYGSSWSSIGTVSATSPRELTKNYLNIGHNYYFAVKAILANGLESQFSPIKHYVPGRRYGLSSEGFEELKIDNSLWNSLEFLMGGLELYSHHVLYDFNDKAAKAEKTLLGHYSFWDRDDQWLDIGRSMFDWDLQAVSSVYYLFIFEEDPGDSEKYSVGISMKFPLEKVGEVTLSSGYELTVKDNDEYLGRICISHDDPTMGWNEGEGLIVNTIYGNARIMISYDGLQLW